MSRNQSLPKYLRGREVDRLSDAVATDRDRMLIMTARFTGLRVSELCALRVEDVDPEDQVLLVRQGKGKKDRYVPLPDKLFTPLWAFIGARTTGPVFRNYRGERLSTRTVQLMVRAAAQAAGIGKRTTPHMLRHTYATNLLNRGASLREVQELLGHASVSTTERYTHVAVDRLKGAVDRL